jgi:hypothetical protein
MRRKDQISVSRQVWHGKDASLLKGDLYIVILVEKEVSHYWKYGYQRYNSYSLKV